jgi:hypothetical protein
VKPDPSPNYITCDSFPLILSPENTKLKTKDRSPEAGNEEQEGETTKENIRGL